MFFLKNKYFDTYVKNFFRYLNLLFLHTKDEFSSKVALIYCFFPYTMPIIKETYTILFFKEELK